MRTTVILLFLAATTSAPLSAQHVHDTGAPVGQRKVQLRAGFQGVPLVTRVDPLLLGDSKLEAYLTQPTAFADAAALGGHVRATAAVSLEAWTLERGELGAGSYGEGYVDRRHPHTLLHELTLSVLSDVGPAAASATIGRGFAPFGTDDPMMRPFVKFPVNHHLAQILERIIAVAAVRGGPVLIEGGVFTGVEPMDPYDTGDFDRFADSWAARFTLFPLAGVELQGSHAWVVSPEMPRGDGWDQRKWSASARVDRDLAGGTLYALAEWNRTTEVSEDIDVGTFGSVLAEAAFDWSGWRPALRVEVAERPEEERLADPFRSPWPHADSHQLGVTRWTILSARVERSLTHGAFRAAPFVEASMTDVRETAGGPFDPQQFYGDTRIWTLNLGARLGLGWHPHRMGRYGVAGDH